MKPMAMPTTSNIAVIVNREDLDSQALLSNAAARWREAGTRVVGVLAENNNVEGACSAGLLRDLSSGRRFSIQLDTPPAGKICHLDATGMEDAGTNLLIQIPAADVVVLSKFGKLEATRKGLWAAFSTAAAAGKPVLTTVSSKHIEAWKAFAPAAAWIEADRASIEQWWLTIQSQARNSGRHR